MSERLSENLMGERDRLIDERDKLQAENAKLKAELELARQALKGLLEETMSYVAENWQECNCSQCTAMQVAKSALETKEAR